MSNTSASGVRTLLLVHTKNHDDFVPANADELLYTSDTSSRQFGEQDHSVDVIVFEELDVSPHFRDLLHIDLIFRMSAQLHVRVL